MPPQKYTVNLEYLPHLLAFIGIALIEILCFSPIVKHVGFYLDDWVMINYLSTAPRDFSEMLKYYFSVDPRVVNRPIEAIHFIIMYKIGGLKPLGYHVFNGVLEIIAGGLLYMALLAVGKNRAAAFIGTALFLLYPSHNTTHYWIVSSSVSLSLVFYLTSLNLDIQAALKNKPVLHFASALIFLLSLLNYEVFLPLALINVLTVGFIRWQVSGLKQDGLKAAALCSSTLGLAIALLFIYLKLIMPFLGSAWMHHIRLEPGLMFNTILSGINLNLPWTAIPYFFNAAQTRLNIGLSPVEIFLLAGQGFCFFIVVKWLTLNQHSGDDSGSTKIDTTRYRALFLILLGLLTVPVSYIIFGINEEYMPTFLTIVNRVNTGATIGLAFIASGIVMLLSGGKALQQSLKIATFTFIVVGCTLVNWGLAMPFIISWQLQAQIVQCVKTNYERLKDAKSVFLINAPRYSGEAPVYDGVWDLEQMLQIYLKNKKVHGGVISDRLHISQEHIQDISSGFTCATYDWDGMYAIISPTCEIMKVEGPEQFILLLEKKAKEFNPGEKQIQKWKEQLKSSRTK